MGRVGMDICKTQPNVIYAQIEVAPDKETGAAIDQPGAPTTRRPAARGGRAPWYGGASRWPGPGGRGGARPCSTRP
jgi:hypothetical protein